MKTSMTLTHEIKVEEKVNIEIHSGLFLHSYYTKHPEALDAIKTAIAIMVKEDIKNASEERARS
jgi:hypothetical protein